MLSVIIHTKNSARTLKKTLQSVRFADEILVVDMKSEDDTWEIAQQFTRRILSVRDYGYVEPARNYALSKAKYPWVLIVDADEEVPAELRAFIERVVQDADAGKTVSDVYAFPRKNMVFEGWQKTAGWWPDYQIRFFKKGSVSWSDEIHAVPRITGSVQQLPPQEKYALLHHNYPSVSAFVDRMNRYTDKEVLHRPQKNIYPSTIVSGFRHELMSRLFHLRGVDGGVRGVGVSLLQSLYEVLVRLKQWEVAGHPQSDDRQTYHELRGLQEDLAYWLADWKIQETTGLEKMYWMMRRKLKV